MSDAKLTKAQADLLEAMRKGVICHYMPYAGSFNPTAYYFRSDTMRRCTAQVKALMERGLAEKYAEEWRGHRVRAKASSPTP